MAQVYKVTVSVNTPRAGNIENVMHYDAPDPSSTDQPWEVANDIANAWYGANATLYEANIGVNCTVTAIRAERIYPTGGPTAVKVVNEAGGGAVEMWNSSECINCQLITDVPPYHEGHQFIGALPHGSIENNEVQPGILATIVAYLTALVLPLVGTLPGLPSYHIGIWNRKTHTLEKVIHTQVAPKPTALNKRLGPYL